MSVPRCRCGSSRTIHKVTGEGTKERVTVICQKCSRKLNTWLRNRRTGTRGFLRQTFEARDLPEGIWVNEHFVPGPFCVHCGNPHIEHDPEGHCPDQHLSVFYPAPKLPFALAK